MNTGRFNFAPPSLAPAVPGASEVQPFGEWMHLARPEYRWDAPHFQLMQRTLDRVTSGELRRVFFQVPIRHGKSAHNTIGYAAYRLEKNPRTRIIVGSYAEKQAHKFSRDIRQLAKGRGVDVSRDRDTAGEWETTSGGGVRAFGSGAGVASVNADLIIIDDPIGSRSDAESQAHRDRVWDWITSDLLARCEPHTAVLFTMSRWHQDDPAGRLRDRQADRWHVIDLPGRAEANDALGRKEGEPLWPELRGEQWLEGARVDLLDYGFASLIQGRPRPREGGMFKWPWWQLIDAVPATGNMIRYWDLAGTEARGRGHDPDFSVGALLCRMPDSRTAIVDIARFRKSIAQRDAELERIAIEDRQKYGGRVKWWIETEAGIAGEERTQALVRRLQLVGLSVSTEHPTGKKIFRAEPLASKAEAGNVVLCTGGRKPDGTPVNVWLDPFRSEAADFPNGKHDDQIDAVAGADSKLAVRTAAGVFSHSI